MIGNGFLTVKKSTFRYNYALNGGAISINLSLIHIYQAENRLHAQKAILYHIFKE